MVSIPKTDEAIENFLNKKPIIVMIKITNKKPIPGIGKGINPSIKVYKR